MNNITKFEEIKIKDMIYEIRGKQVMLDSELAKLYQVETRTINQKVKRNIERFPESFCFKITKTEWENLKSQIVISNSNDIEFRGCDTYFIIDKKEIYTVVLR